MNEKSDISKSFFFKTKGGSQGYIDIEVHPHKNNLPIHKERANKKQEVKGKKARIVELLEKRCSSSEIKKITGFSSAYINKVKNNKV